MASADTGNAKEEGMQRGSAEPITWGLGAAVLVTSLPPFLHIPLVRVLNRKQYFVKEVYQ